ncbi:MAG: hypothetical protein WC984_10575 [Bacteroidales bacterium]
MRKVILFVFVFLYTIQVHSQIYYGEKDFGRIELLKDSIMTVSFAREGYEDLIDTCYYRIKGDTMFLSSKIKKRYEVEINDKRQPIGDGFPVLVKYYWKTGKGYELVFEYLPIYDTVNEQIVFNGDFPINEGVILVIYDEINYNRMIWENGLSKKFTIKKVKNSGLQHVFFDDFPLLVKGGKLIPIDKDKNFLSWVNNGFYFPIMKRAKKEMEYKTIGIWTIGLRGLPSGFEIK